MSSNELTVTQVAVHDAARVAAECVDASNLTQAEVHKLAFEEHKTLGYHPPKGSLAAKAQGEDSEYHNVTNVKEATLKDAAKVAIERQEPVPERSVSAGLDLDQIGEVEGRKLVSNEHKALGHRPPHELLAAVAQSAAAKHPNTGKDSLTEEDRQKLARAALLDAARIEAE
ncbi:hypothetical protein BDQ17DRAFT_1540044 [Cyathus striatus]|nr:hypothetical protein BDQ17DRAFT_1540044 [Cyathus striatus]